MFVARALATPRRYRSTTTTTRDDVVENVALRRYYCLASSIIRTSLSTRSLYCYKFNYYYYYYYCCIRLQAHARPRRPRRVSFNTRWLILYNIIFVPITLFIGNIRVLKYVIWRFQSDVNMPTSFIGYINIIRAV
jgi:hypothetical protein